MNYFTELSIELANQRDYLDQLFRVYPLRPDSIRNIDDKVWMRIEKAYAGTDNVELIKSLMEHELFPIKDGYLPYLRLDKAAIERNPNTVNRICGRIRELGLDKLYERCTQPKETNRQMGPLFKRWLKSGALGVAPVSKEVFHATTDNAILDGSDKDLQTYAEQYLGYKRNKGIDFLARFNGVYVIGEAKFISDEGGHQNDQFVDAMQTVMTDVNPDVKKVAILDGVLYIKSRRKMYSQITTTDVPVLSALLLREYLYCL